MRKRLILFAPLLLIVLCTPVKPQEEEWVKAHKVDDIETFYQVEKVGSNELEVRVKVLNGRAKEVRVWVDIEYKYSGVQRGGGIILEGRKPSKSTTVTVAARRSTMTKVHITAEEITGVKIQRWLNEDLAKEEDKEEDKDLKLDEKK
jgi:hypothetical protein